VLACLGAAGLVAAPAWTPQTSGVTARLRGVSAVSDRVAWASGAGGTILRTGDGGETWRQMGPPDAGALDFRDIDAVNDRTAYALSIGPGDASRIYKTQDAGATWALQFTNDDAKAFFDAMAFWDEERGVAFSDSVDGQFVILVTTDGGRTWTRAPAEGLPPALPNEGAFAASGTNVAVVRPNHVWIGTTAGRVLRSRDGGRTWDVAQAPVATGNSAGIFSIAFRSATDGIVVGGDYRQEEAAFDNAATTSDGGRTWTLVKGLRGYRSVVAYVPRSRTRALIAAGPSGADMSEDDGRTWRALGDGSYDSFSFSPSGRLGWGVGEGGRIGWLKW
jgi:photosystem II stability/assembly factor-like uncharacterized protein